MIVAHSKERIWKEKTIFQPRLFKADEKKCVSRRLAEWVWPDPNLRLCIGIDEAGRGALAGEIFAAAVAARRETAFPSGLNDSKLLSEKKREELFEEICELVPLFGIGSASVEEIERLNPLQATMLAMTRAVSALGPLPSYAAQVLVDGDRSPSWDLPTLTMVRGDQSVPSIAAASILAKVSRDRSMRALAKEYPAYGFEAHKGYGVKTHLHALFRFGPSPYHRNTFAPVRAAFLDASSVERSVETF